MVALKHLDPLMGLDTHILLIPTPVGPVPTPIPHPYVGMLMDVFDYLPIVGTVIKVNGLPRAVAGTAGEALPPHIPMGGPFAKPPMSESEMFMGSATVNADGGPMSFLGCPVLSCQDIGMPSPPRPSKKGLSMDLKLPVTQAMPIPGGPPVIVGGPPTIIMPGLEVLLGPLAKRLVKAIGKGARKSKILRALQKGLDKYEALVEKVHDKAEALMQKCRVPKFLRDHVHNRLCSATGHPVDVANGRMFTELTDFELPGPIPFRFERGYDSSHPFQSSLGHGWHHNWDMALFFDDDAVLVRLADGRYVPFLQPRTEGPQHNRAEKLSAGHDAQGYWLWDHASDLVYRFGAAQGRAYGELVLSEVQRHGHRVRCMYDPQGRLSQVVDTAGRTVGFAYDAAGRLVELSAPHPTDPSARIPVMHYTYDGYGDLVQTRDAMGHTQRFAYANHLLVQETDKNGLSFTFQYDGSDPTARCVRTWGDGGLYDRTLTYRPDAGITEVVDSLGHKTTYFHDGAMVTRVLDPHGNESLTELDDDHLVVAEVDELGRATRYEYDAAGNLTLAQQPDGSSLRLRYDPTQLPVEALDALGQPWRWDYDEHRQLTRRVDPLGREVHFRYHGPWLVAMVDAAGATTRLGYDAQGNLHELHAPDGGVTRWHHDGWGQVFAVDDPNGNRQLRQRDALGRVVRVEEPDGNVRELRYDPEGNVLHAKDRHHDVRFTYQGMGRMTSRSEAGTTVRFHYDTEEQLTAIANEHGRVYAFTLGPTGDVLEERGFGGLARRYTRDAAGQVTRVDRPPLVRDGQEHPRFSDYRYDPAGRVTEVAHSDGVKETYAYRLDGELLIAAGPEGTVQFERDALGRVTKETQGGKHWVESEYDLLGLRVRMTSSLGAEQHIERNAMGDALRVREAGGFEVTFTRDLLGLELERLLPGGVRSKWQRDKLGRPLRHEVTVGDSLKRAVSYQWDVNDRLQRLVDALEGPTHYTHDAMGNLVAANYSDGTVELRMPDAVGNLFRSEGRADRTYGPAGELLSIEGPKGTTRYEYDAEGNRIAKHEPSGRSWHYEYNPAGMMSAVVRPDGSRVEFRYDPLGRRIQKRYRGQTTHWVWDGNNPLHEWVEGRLLEVETPEVLPLWLADAEIKKREAELSEHLAQGPPKRGSKDAPITWLFEPESFAPMARLQGGAASSIVTDHLDTPVGMYDAGGTRLWAAGISIWGELRDFEGPEHEGEEEDDNGAGSGDGEQDTLAARLAVPFRWPGQYEDAETGLYYNRFRYYDPESGGYCSQDPIGLLGGTAVYIYPPDVVSATDPFGLICNSLHERRQKVAYNHYRRSGMSHDQALSHMNEIDFSKPVSVRRLKKGKGLTQHRNPSRPVGNYFAEPGTPASQLGINPKGRSEEALVVTRDTKALSSTAAPVTDTWTDPGTPFDAEGSGKQLFVADKRCVLAGSPLPPRVLIPDAALHHERRRGTYANQRARPRVPQEPAGTRALEGRAGAAGPSAAGGQRQ